MYFHSSSSFYYSPPNIPLKPHISRLPGLRRSPSPLIVGGIHAYLRVDHQSCITPKYSRKNSPCRSTIAPRPPIVACRCPVISTSFCSFVYGSLDSDIFLLLSSRNATFGELFFLGAPSWDDRMEPGSPCPGLRAAYPLSTGSPKC